MRFVKNQQLSLGKSHLERIVVGIFERVLGGFRSCDSTFNFQEDSNFRFPFEYENSWHRSNEIFSKGVGFNRNEARKSGGETGIRTRGAFGTHAFQACTIDHSDISPVISTAFHKKKRSLEFYLFSLKKLRNSNFMCDLGMRVHFGKWFMR